MQELKLNNKDNILTTIKNYALKNNLDYLSLMEDFYKVITSEVNDSKHLDSIIYTLKDVLKKDTIWETEEELFHVISYELDKQYTDLVLKNSNEEDITKINEFLTTNYLDIFKSFYEKNNSISKLDYEECVLSIYNNFIIEEEIVDIIVGKWLEDNIITK